MFVAAANSAELRCNFIYRDFRTSQYYECDGEITTTTSDYNIERVTGDHVAGFSNDDVMRVTFRNASMKVMAQGVGRWFKEFRQYVIRDMADLSSFKRSDFSDMPMLDYFQATNLPSLRDIPKDTFYDLKELSKLSLDNMRNLENLDSDLLIKAPQLMFLSVTGPNKINQINKGFFREQGSYLNFIAFSNTTLKRISYPVFQHLDMLQAALFRNAGCLNHDYLGFSDGELTADIRKHCEDVTGGGQNNIMKKKSRKSSSSTSSSSDTSSSSSSESK